MTTKEVRSFPLGKIYLTAQRVGTPPPARKGGYVKKKYGKILLAVALFTAALALAGIVSAAIPFQKSLQEGRDPARQPEKTAEPGENREGMSWEA